MIHEHAYADEDVDRDTWVTPYALAMRLGRWELDPCSNAYSHIIADKAFDLERRGQDALVLAKYVRRGTRAFINPPYSHGHVLPFVEAYAHTRFCFLLRFDPSTAWFERLWPMCELICTLRERINFEPPPGFVPKHNLSNPFPHALYYRRACDATPAILAASYVMHPSHTIKEKHHG